MYIELPVNARNKTDHGKKRTEKNGRIVKGSWLRSMAKFSSVSDTFNFRDFREWSGYRSNSRKVNFYIQTIGVVSVENSAMKAKQKYFARHMVLQI